MASERLRQALAILRGHRSGKDPLLHQLHHDLESVFWVALVFVVQRCDADGTTKYNIHRLVTGDMETVDQAKGDFTHHHRGICADDFELKGPCEFLMPFFRGFVGLCDSPADSLNVENVLKLIDDAIGRAPQPPQKFAKASQTPQSVNPSVGEKRSIHSSTLDPADTESECSQRPKKVKKAAATKTGEAHL